MTFRKKTSAIQRIALSIPRAFASRATHTSKVMLIAKKMMGTRMNVPQQLPHAAAPAAGGGGLPWARQVIEESKVTSANSLKNLVQESIANQLCRVE